VRPLIRASAPLTRDVNIGLRTSARLRRPPETHASGTPEISCARPRSRRHERSAAWAPPLLASEHTGAAEPVRDAAALRGRNSHVVDVAWVVLIGRDAQRVMWLTFCDQHPPPPPAPAAPFYIVAEHCSIEFAIIARYRRDWSGSPRRGGV